MIGPPQARRSVDDKPALLDGCYLAGVWLAFSALSIAASLNCCRLAALLASI